MASNVSVSTGHELTIDDLRNVYTALITLASKFRYIGLEVKVPPHILNEIDMNKYDCKEKLYSVLEYRLKQRIPLTWEDIVRALRSPAVNEHVLASQIEYDYLPHSSSQSVPTPVPPVSDTSDRPGPSHQPSHQQQLLHLPSHQPFHLQHPMIQSRNQFPGSSVLVTNTLEPVQSGQPNRTEQYTSFAPSQQKFLLHLQHILSSLAPVPQDHQQQYHPHIQQVPSEQVQFPRPIIQPPTQSSHRQTPHPQLRHSPVHMQYSSNPLSSPSNDSQQSQSPQQPSSVHTVSTPPQYHSPQQVSLSHEQSLSPAPLTKQPRLEPRASSRQQSVPPPSPSSSTLVASHTPTPQESIQTSSLQHVQSVTGSSGVSKTYSKAMTNFIHYVKNVYRSRKVETFVKFALNPTKVYINLALIDRHVVEHKEYKDITVAMIQDGNVDVIQEKKEQIELDKIASGIPYPPSEGNEGEDKRLILVEGAPGVGKSTFAWEFCRRWLLRKVAQGYDLVLLLRLRDMRIRTAKRLIDLLYDPSGDVSKEVLDELLYTNHYNVLLILEGYDELPDSVRKDPNSIFSQLISGELLPLATILVTSRPWATKDIRKRHQCRLYQHIEVLGFTKRQINEYIEATVPAENVNDLTSYLERHPQIRSGMYIPLNSAIVVAVYLASQRGTQPLPKTQTELYTSLVDILIGRHMESHPQLKETIKVKFPFLGGISLPVEIYQHLVDLSKLAYNGIVESGDEVKLIFNEEELPQNFDNLGFMDSFTDLYLNQETKSSHNFLHLTFQEFFAAAYISTMPLEEQREYYQEIIDRKGGRLNVVLKFLSGLKKLDCFIEENAMCIMKQSQHKPPYEFISPPECMIGIDVINWMFEAQSEDKISMILGERRIEFKEKKSKMSQMDYYSLGYCISHSLCQWVLSLTGRNVISKEKIAILAESATGSGPGRIVEFGYEVVMNLSGGVFNYLIQDWFHCLSFEVLPPGKFEETTLNRILSSTSSLMYLSFKEQWNYEPITEALLNNQLMSLKILKFEEIELTTLAGQYLIQFLKDTKLLDHFSLIQCVVPAQELLQVFQVVQQNPVIRESEIIKCKFQVTCDDDFQCIDKLLVLNILEENVVQTFRAVFGMESKCLTETVRSRKTVDLSKGKLNMLCTRTTGTKSFIKALFNTTTFAELNISNNLGYLGESCVVVAEALQKNSTLLTLNMSHNSIGDEGAQYLAEALKHNSTLETLNISHCNIGDDGVVALSQALLQNFTLKVLSLTSNGITNTGVACLSDALEQNSTLLHLDLLDNRNIDVEGATSLAKALSNNSTLEELKLRFCSVGDDGANALSQSLVHNSSLKVLGLEFSSISNRGAAAIAKALTQNSTLLHLDLSSNRVGDEGLKFLSEALTQNSTLLHLDLSWNGIGDEGLKFLSEALTQNSTLLHLDLSNNRIGDEGLKFLSEALTHNSALEELNLSWCEISDKGATALSEAPYKNSSLKVLNLNYNIVIKQKACEALVTATNHQSIHLSMQTSD